MCGRFALAVGSAQELIAFFKRRLPPGTDTDPAADALDIVPRFNVAPSQDVPVLRVIETDDGLRASLSMRHWGLIPSWSKGDDKAVRRRSFRMINARAETVFDKPSFRVGIARRRGLVATNGFYEWDRSKDKPRPATLFHRPGRELFAMAAICERWKGPDGVVDSFTILTTAANATVAPLHDRMPVVITDDDAMALWLDPTVRDKESLGPLLAPAPDELLRATLVGTTVNDARRDTEACWQPVA